MTRTRSLDLARGFTVLFIPAIHTVMVYSNPVVHDTWLGWPLRCIAEGPGGQLLMMLMGVVFAFKEKHDAKTVLVKSIMLVLAGYVLNVLKFILPLYFGWLPKEILIDLEISPGTKGIFQLLLLGDILQFAAVALLIIYFVHRLKNYAAWSVSISIIIIFASPLFWDLHSDNYFIDYLLQLLGGQPPRVFFPLMPWLAYPLMGFAIGSSMKQKDYSVFPILTKTGVVLTLSGLLCSVAMEPRYHASFYRTWPWDTLWHSGIVLLTLAFWHYLDQRLKNIMIINLLTYCSRHISQIYIIQWIVVAWMLPVFGYQQLLLVETIMAMLVTSAITFSISVLLTKINSQ